MKKIATFLCKAIATGFGSGLSPIAPGTIGGLLALAVWIICLYPQPYDTCTFTNVGLVVFFTITGIPAATVCEKYWGKDPNKVVVDEMVGTWVALLAVPKGYNEYWWAVSAFILFRILDIFKPFGIKRMERFRGGLGVMADDILAGLYSAMLLMIAQHVL